MTKHKDVHLHTLNQFLGMSRNMFLRYIDVRFSFSALKITISIHCDGNLLRTRNFVSFVFKNGKLYITTKEEECHSLCDTVNSICVFY